MAGYANNPKGMPVCRFIGLILLMLLILPAGSAMAGSGEETAYQPQTVTITIDAKGRQVVRGNSYDDYVVSPRTLIVGTDNKQLDFDQMPVPCEARVLFMIHEGQRHVLEIRLQSVGRGATTQFQLGGE